MMDRPSFKRNKPATVARKSEATPSTKTVKQYSGKEMAKQYEQPENKKSSKARITAPLLTKSV